MSVFTQENSFVAFAIAPCEWVFTPFIKFSRNTQSWQCWHLIQMDQTIFKEFKILIKKLSPLDAKKEFFCMYTLGIGEKK